MRGRRYTSSPKTTTVGSIPAYAGEAVDISTCPQDEQVDPRVCGGGHHHDHDNKSGWGRSPRMRGRPSSSTIINHAQGSIPAYAGEAA